MPGAVGDYTLCSPLYSGQAQGPAPTICPENGELIFCKTHLSSIAYLIAHPIAPGTSVF